MPSTWPKQFNLCFLIKKILDNLVVVTTNHLVSLCFQRIVPFGILMGCVQGLAPPSPPQTKCSDGFCYRFDHHIYTKVFIPVSAFAKTRLTIDPRRPALPRIEPTGVGHQNTPTSLTNTK